MSVVALSQQKITASMLCREMLDLLAKPSAMRKAIHLYGKDDFSTPNKHIYVDIELLPEDLSMSLDDLSKKFAPLADRLALTLIEDEASYSYDLPLPNYCESARHRLNGICLRAIKSYSVGTDSYFVRFDIGYR